MATSLWITGGIFVLALLGVVRWWRVEVRLRRWEQYHRVTLHKRLREQWGPRKVLRARFQRRRQLRSKS